MDTVKLFNDNISNDEDYSLDDYRAEQFAFADMASVRINDPEDDAAITLYMVEQMKEIERICHILDMLEVGERFTTSENETTDVTFVRVR